ncbi:hypothetical protein BCT46_01080 [Vibrio sp. 10N.261.46.E8]|uniref:hypothetical protein n=1 Tax=unclassified Vibrio TaxID=2614977 RepID=UPI00097B66C3|nr:MULTISPECIES: hypothetical protein [unclassified Vibrio]PMM69683.1 hypothetical protein BCT48_09835 [Vibrio sp. 10N.261.46.F12]PMN31127.1 hypothetical protein BCT34_15150 [Vibrio sp. 10N.261.45.E2]PMN55292.1 hypothetical protein BCT32_02235 [Vibrio sp. 10N.261.45.E11]PMN92210.1 hypothetical protein BCT25_00420 [Vibrio sp. 10N.261.45.A6]OMO32560.1 hypothetical protein BH584_16235 [Vibrio sp. 10N.261.45.E1]
MAKREVAKESELTVRYYIISKELSAKELLNATRSSWLVESMRWSLDTASKTSRGRCRKLRKVQADVLKRVEE